MWWTTPLYLVFLSAGAYSVGFILTPTLELLLGVLVAFGLLDGMVLLRIAAIRARPIETVGALEAARSQIERLSRILLLGGGAFGAAFLLGVVALVYL